jgi:RHS repeat-associated protein
VYGPKWTFYLYGLGGEKLGSVVCTQAGYNCARESANVYFGGKLVATMDAAGTYSGIVTDRLGSVRATKTGGGAWTQTNYYAWGEEKSPVSADGKTKYATYTRDSTLSGQDYADQRYYSNIMGRFFSPDPAASASASDPQSWNRYLYVQGDPVNFTDNTGLLREGPGSDIPTFSTTLVRTEVTVSDTMPGDSFPLWAMAKGARQPIVGHATLADGLEMELGVSETCAKGLVASGARGAALAGALNAKETLQAVASANGVDWKVLAAISMRESTFTNKSSSNGMAGYFQINASANGLTVDQVLAMSFEKQAEVAAGILKLFSNRWAGVATSSGVDALSLALANYDGVSPSKIRQSVRSDNPASALDALTDRGNYIGNVKQLTDCFH